MRDDVSSLTQLGSNQTDYKYDNPSAEILETFPNQFPDRNYVIDLEFPEFTSLCPRTGQPDFARIEISYVADQKCVESKSLKLYFFSWRNHGSFMETITNAILEHFIEACQPKWAEVRGYFNARGGLVINVTAAHGEMP